MARWIERRWRDPARFRAIDLLLRPLAGLYRIVVLARRGLYRHGWLRTTTLPVPVVVVGNVVVGGAGKTPVTMALAEALQARGLRVGVIARGYGRQTRDCREVLPDSHARDVGDEPLLIRQRTGAPVFVARQRAEAGLALLAAYPDTQVVLCDDGLQHLALARTCELCVMPPGGTGNGRLLPAGPLREPWPRPVDAVIQTGLAQAEQAGNADLLQGQQAALAAAPSTPTWPASRTLATTVRNAAGQRLPLAHFAAHAPAAQAAGSIIAIAGIAQPEAFFSMLQARGIVLNNCVALGDHHDFATLPAALQQAPADCAILCTEKDAVKLWPLLPQAWAVPLEVALPAALIEQVLNQLRHAPR